MHWLTHLRRRINFGMSLCVFLTKKPAVTLVFKIGPVSARAMGTEGLPVKRSPSRDALATSAASVGNRVPSLTGEPAFRGMNHANHKNEFDSAPNCPRPRGAGQRQRAYNLPPPHTHPKRWTRVLRCTRPKRMSGSPVVPHRIGLPPLPPVSE